MNALDPSRRRALGIPVVSAAERQRWKPVIARAKVKPD